jgi:hypothetical protein
MRWESGAGRDAVFIDHAKVAESHEPWVVVAVKRERMIRIKPAMIGVTAFCGLSDLNHMTPFHTAKIAQSQAAGTLDFTRQAGN